MNKEEIEELMEYNLEYLEARNSEDIFGGDYTSSVDLKYVNKELENLKQINEQHRILNGQLRIEEENLQDQVNALETVKNSLLKENKQLKEKIQELRADYGNKAQVERDLLHQENKQLKEEIKQLQKELGKADSITQSCIFQGKKESGISFRNCLNKMTEYKIRIDKAIEYIEKNSFDKQEKPMIWVRVFKKDLHGYANELLKTLKGE